MLSKYGAEKFRNACCAVVVNGFGVSYPKLKPLIVLLIVNSAGLNLTNLFKKLFAPVLSIVSVKRILLPIAKPSIAVPGIVKAVNVAMLSITVPLLSIWSICILL